jgi:hypothetical protein
MGRTDFRWKDPRLCLPPRRFHRRGARALRFLCDGAADLAFFLLLLEEHDLMGVGTLPPSLSFKDFHHAAGLRSPPVVIYKDDYQPCGGEKRAGLWPPPCPQLQGCSSSSLGWKASRVGVLPSTWAGDPLLPPTFGGEGCSPTLRRRQTLATRC